METTGVPTESKTPNSKITEASLIHWYWDSAHNCFKIICIITWIGTPQELHIRRSSYYRQPIKQYWHRQKTINPLQLYTTRNFPSTRFTKSQYPIHSGMSASTQKLISTSPLEWLANTKRLWDIYHKITFIGFWFMHGKALNSHVHRCRRALPLLRDAKT